MATTLRSYAKVNLGLAIGPPRSDGFHDLITVYQTIALHDFVSVAARLLPASATRSRISLTSNNARVPCDARNTAWRMVSLALEESNLVAEVHIHIEKQLPIQGGMGAGSANAAAALLALERELAVSIPDAIRLALAAKVGSDVPLFLVGGTVLGSGRGEIVEPAVDLPATSCVVALPEIGVSTPQAFRDWDALREASRLTSSSQADTLGKLKAAYASLRSTPDESYTSSSAAVLIDLLRRGIGNDFETVVFPQYPQLKQIKSIMMQGIGISPAIYAALSGSGSAVFGLYQSDKDAQSVQQALRATGVRALVTGTLPREAYWSKMVAEAPDR